MPAIDYCLFETPLGTCGIAWRPGANEGAPPAVTSFQFPEATPTQTAAHLERRGARPSHSLPPAIACIIGRIRNHLAGQIEDFSDIDVDLNSLTAFARQVYAAARAIPAGQTRSYGEIARILARPNVARAVGQALARNPIPLIIPCHRIVAAGGKPGGFSAPGGWTTKSRLLSLEGVLLAKVS